MIAALAITSHGGTETRELVLMVEEVKGNRALIVSAVCLAAMLMPEYLAFLWGRLAIIIAIALAIVGLMAAVRALQSASVRGLAAFNAVLWLSVVLPVLVLPFVFLVPSYTESTIGRFAQRVVFLTFAGPQWMFFAGTLRWAGQNGDRVVPELLRGPADIAFWILIAIAFAALTRRIQSVPIIFITAVATVAVVVLAMQVLIPAIGWTTHLDFP